MAAKGRIRELPEAVVGRLTKYLTCAQGFVSEGAEWVSSKEIGAALGITPATVRRDLAGLDVGGMTHRGYQTERLHDGLVRCLGADTGWKAVVVGAGNLGKALALHGNLSRLGIRICGIFDTDGRKVGKKVGKLTVRPMREMPRTIHREAVDMGVIAVPAAAAQSVADLMIIAGVRGIFNLAFIHVAVPRSCRMVEGRLVAGILELGHAIKRFSETSESRKAG
jgi:redox-sensing transcriptional repressor